MDWQECHQEAFEKLKKLCSEALILAYAEYKTPFRVYTDASEIGFGAIIGQKRDDGEPTLLVSLGGWLRRGFMNTYMEGNLRYLRIIIC